VSGPSGTHRRRVEWADTDASGIHHNTAVARFVEAAEAELMRGLGIDFAPTAPRVRYEVEFTTPLRFGDEAVVTVQVGDLGRTSLTFDFEVRRGADDVLAARGRYVVVHVDSFDGGATPWPDDWRAVLGAEQG
jgi:acyl-CoA thioester hydrolase